MYTSGFSGSLHYSINTKLEIIGIKRWNRRLHITEVLILIRKGWCSERRLIVFVTKNGAKIIVMILSYV